MAGKPRPAARQAFNDNIADAQTLVLIVKALQNKRVRRMRRELRERLGSALDLPRKQWDGLDCIESDDLFAVFKPGSNLDRAALEDVSLSTASPSDCRCLRSGRDFRRRSRNGAA